jgi:hypothetical protein
MRGGQDIATALTLALTDLMPAQIASVQARYGLPGGQEDGGLENIASFVDTVDQRPEDKGFPQIQVEIVNKRTERMQGTVEPELGGNITLDRRFGVRLWVFLRGQSFPDVSHRQRYTAQAVEEVLMGNVVIPSDPTIRLDPSTVTYDLSDVGIDAKSSRSVGAVRVTFDVMLTEEILPFAPPQGTADSYQIVVTDLPQAPASIHPAFA